MDLFWTLTLRATLLLGGILLANCFLRNTNPRWRILLCEAGSAALLLLPLILWWKPLTLDLPVMPPEPTGPVLEPIPIPTGEPIPLAAPEPTASAVPPMNSEPFPVQSDSEPRPKVSLTNTVAPWIYSFGLLTLLLFYLRRRQQLNRYLGRLSRPDRALQTQFDRLVGDFHLSRKPRCLLTRETVSPFCSGIFRPVVAIPDSLAAPADRETLEMVLRHELAHLENGDLLRTSWMNVVTLLFWFHPLIWFLRRNHAMALEELADRTAASDEPSGASYRTTLARLALLLRDVPAPPPGTVGIFGPPQILVRLNRLGFHLPHQPLSCLARTGVWLGLIAPLLLVLSSTQLVRAQAEITESRLAWIEELTEDQRASATRCLNRAMETLKANQSPDGSMARNMEMARRPGQESGVTALAGMAFFLHGGSNVESPYHAPLMKCLDYVLDCQAPGGWFHQSSDGKPGSLYHHAIATWFLAHLKEPLKEDNRSDPINKALTLGVDQLVKAQKIPKPKINRGGWRYTAESRDGDLSCTAWALRALVAARKAGIDVPARTLTDASVYVRSLQTPDGSFAYTAGGQGMPTNVPRAAMGLYCLQSVGQGRTEAADQAAAYILRESSQPQTAYEFYGILWSANAMGRRGGNDRSQYAQWMVPHLEHSQRPDGTWNSQNGALLGALFGALAYLPPEAVVPDIKSQLERDQAIKTMMANGRQIVTAIKLWGGDFSGNYPTAQNDANEALRKLFPIYMDEETIFHLPGSLFCSPAAPDERFQKAEEALRPGENGWAYVSGHTDTDRSTLPVLALGFTANGNQYDHQHLLWKEKKTIVIYLDGKVELKDLHPVGDGDTWELRGSGPHANRNLFDPGLLEGGRLLNPMKPQRALPRKDRPEERRQKDISRQVDDQI